MIISCKFYFLASVINLTCFFKRYYLISKIFIFLLLFSFINFELYLTLIFHTDGIVTQVLKEFLMKHGKKWNSKGVHKIVGKTPLEAATVVVEDYGLPCTPEEFMSTFTPMFSDQ